MARRKTPQQWSMGPDLAAIGIITLSFLLLASLLYGGRDSGPVLRFLADVLQLSLGMGAWIVPLAGLAIGVCLGMEEKPAIPRGVTAGGLVLYVVLLSMFHLAGAGDYGVSAAAVRHAGGYIGAAIGWTLQRAFGDLGAYIVLVGAALAGTIMVAQTSWTAFLARLGEAILGIGRAFATFVASALGALPRPVVRQRPEPAVAGPGPSRKPPQRRPAPVPGPGIFEPDEDEEADATQAEPEAAEPEPQLTIDADEAAEGPAASGEQAVVEPAPEAPQASSWSLPPPDLLRSYPDDFTTAEDTAEIREKIRVIEQTLLNFGIPARVVAYQHGPTLTRFEVQLEPGVRVAKVTQLQRELKMALAADKLRIEAPIPGKRAVGIEVPNEVRRIVSLRSVLETDAFQEHPSLMAVALGKDVAGEPVVVDIEAMPHLLVAGQTGSGKSVCLHTIIVSLLMRATPDQVRLVLIDPKRVELTRYDSIPHLFSPVVYTIREAADVLRKCIREMQRRYDRFAVAGVSNIVEYNAELAEGTIDDELGLGPMPRIVVVIDELADLMTRARAEFEQSICLLARQARATGIHVVAATQRPSVNVVTGQIKANFAARIALRLPASHDSRTVLDGVGADKLLGNGDMLLLTSDLSKPVRIQGAYVDRRDVEQVAAFLRAQGEPDYEIVPEIPDEGEGGEMPEEEDVGDELFEAAVRYVVSEQEASVSMLQRRFKIGYARAGRLIDLMERRGIVGPHEGSRPRRVLVGPHNVDQVLAGVYRASEAEEHPEEEAAAVDSEGGE